MISPSLAQRARPNGRGQLDAARVAFMTQQINLTPEEAQQFWPVYNNYQKEADALLLERARIRKDKKAAPDDDDELAFKSKMLDLQKKYRSEFIRILPKEKAAGVYRAEREFRQNLINELGNRLREARVKN